MTIILSAGLSQHVEHSFDDDDEDDSNSGRHLRHHRQEDEDELSEAASKRSSGNLNENLGGQRPAGGAISAPKVDGGAKGDTRLLLATGLASFAAGNLAAPGNRDRIAAFIDIRIAIAFLITCGFIIMEQCRARKCRDGLDVMATHEQISHEKDGTSVLKEKHLEEYRRGRERVLQALGSIHELPLEANDRIAVCEKHINAGAVQSINECANFSEASSEFMQTIDKCLEVLRIGSGLHIGIGPASKSVCRVENTIVGREYRKTLIRENSQTSKHSPQKFSAPLGLVRAREILHCVMADQFELLNALLASSCDVEDGEISLHRSAIMSPLTLSSLVTWRKALGKLLSQLLAELCAVKGPDTDNSLDNMKVAIITVRERNLYLQSCFPVSCTNSTEENGSAQHVQKRHLDNIHRRIDAALVSIWAFENSAPFRNGLDSEQQDGKSRSAKKEWWLRTRDMLLEAIAYWHELDLHLASTGTIMYEDEEDLRSNQDDKIQGTEHQRIENDGTFEFATEQISCQKISDAIAAHPTDKTIIFSGRANRRRLRDKKSGKDGQESNAPHSSSYRNNLLTELQSRIDMIELADEWDAHQEREDKSDTEGDEDVPQGVNEDDEIRTSVRRAMPLVLGGVSLLEELKESTVAVAESENEVALGD